jgi:hypothetical protein
LARKRSIERAGLTDLTPTNLTSAFMEEEEKGEKEKSIGEKNNVVAKEYTSVADVSVAYSVASSLTVGDQSSFEETSSHGGKEKLQAGSVTVGDQSPFEETSSHGGKEKLQAGSVTVGDHISSQEANSHLGKEKLQAGSVTVGDQSPFEETSSHGGKEKLQAGSVTVGDHNSSQEANSHLGKVMLQAAAEKFNMVGSSPEVLSVGESSSTLVDDKRPAEPESVSRELHSDSNTSESTAVPADAVHTVASVQVT